jgi:hypothetical protein
MIPSKTTPVDDTDPPPTDALPSDSLPSDSLPTDDGSTVPAVDDVPPASESGTESPPDDADVGGSEPSGSDG